MATKKQKIKELTLNLLSQSTEAIEKNIDRALKSGAIDIEAWEENVNPMILPKIILTALLLEESTQYDCKGTSFEKEIKKEVNNLRYFL